MSLADELEVASKKRARPCLTASWLSEQDERTNANFRNFIADGGHMSDLYRLCVKYGLDVGLTQFKDHCQRRCCCMRGSVAA